MKRRVIKDRKKLVQVLIDNGWLPDDDGDFAGEGPHFMKEMWEWCGHDVVDDSDNFHTYYTVPEDRFGYVFMPEWTETI